MFRKLTQDELNRITPSMLKDVYSGKQGCMCGCNGKYWSSGPMMKKVLNILKADERLMLQDGYILYIDFPRAQRDERNYVAYLAQPLPLEAQV